MNTTDSTFLLAVQKLLGELFDGVGADEAYVLNFSDVGMIRQMQSLDAATASTRPMKGRTTIAAHVDHVIYGIELLNRFAEGEPNPWEHADWSASWKREKVDEASWRELTSRLSATAERWKRNVAKLTAPDVTAAAGVIASVAHTAYHLGAIRQILAASGK